MFGYKPNVTQVANVDVEFYQQVPAIASGSSYIPDFTYALYIPENTTLNSNVSGSVSFIIQDPVDFAVSSSGDPTEVTVYSQTGNVVNYFLLRKTRKAISATINTTTFSFGEPQPFQTIEINSSRIIGVLDIFDTDNNQWYEVDYLAQDMVFDSIKNTNINNPNANMGTDAPYLLQLKSVQRRFTTRVINPSTLQLQFGVGDPTISDEEIIPNPDNVGLGLPFEKSKLTTAYSPSNFIFTRSYGIAPSNTTLTVRYLTGGGVGANVPSNAINSIVSGNPVFLNPGVVANTANYIFGTLAVNNPNAADGGGDGDSVEQIRQNASSNFATQLRNVTPDDYLVRTLSLPSRYGVISKGYIEPSKISTPGFQSVLDLYVLSYDLNKRLTTSSNTLKQNLKTYLSQYNLMGDKINIKDAFIINININFDIIALPGFNSNEVLTKCILALKDFWKVDNWQINEPIILRDMFILLDKIEGVQTVKSIDITNLSGVALGYSQYSYDIKGATINGVVYPSIDPMIFEVKYPDSDIQGRISNF